MSNESEQIVAGLLALIKDGYTVILHGHNDEEKFSGVAGKDADRRFGNGCATILDLMRALNQKVLVKKCITCKETKAITLFAVAAGHADGKTSNCLQCMRKITKARADKFKKPAPVAQVRPRPC